ncbi:hypothetical protein M8818_005214 [Zalaria obscura]|uniref:Uncharacterized protein n=1 Tax=Zalaria obscura TaxID=2024903 RepID=A0ACC3SDU2_9PEZI
MIGSSPRRHQHVGWMESVYAHNMIVSVEMHTPDSSRIPHTPYPEHSGSSAESQWRHQETSTYNYQRCIGPSCPDATSSTTTAS